MNTQANALSIIPSMIPAMSIDAGAVLYIPLVRFGHAMHTTERELGRLREGELIADMLDAELTDVARVIAVDLIHCTSWDATADIADAIFNHIIRTGSAIPAWLVDFLESNITTSELAPYLRRLAA